MALVVEPFRTETAYADGTATVRVFGDVDLASRDALTETLVAAGEGADLVVLDLGRVPFVDSAGIGALVRALTTLHDRGCKVRLHDAADRVRNVLRITTVDELFDG